MKVDIRGAVGKSAEYLRDKIEQYVEKFGKDFSESISTYTHSGMWVLFIYKSGNEEEIKERLKSFGRIWMIMLRILRDFLL